MNIPANGRVVVIDDKIEEEALPLIKALARTGVAVRFYTGKASELPASPLNGIRLIFLDLKLAGMEFTNDPADLINSLKPVLGRMIDKDNGPYILVGWTKHPEHLKKLCESLNPKPVLWLDLEKSKCITNGVCDLSKISKALKKKLANLEAFKLLFLWEHFVNESAYATVNDFRALFEGNADPNLALSGLLFKLAESHLGKHIKRKSIQEILANALLTLNVPFVDKLETHLGRLANYRSFKIKFPVLGSPAVEATTTSKINARLHLAKDGAIDAVPGNLYAPFNKTLKNLTKEVLSGAIKNVDATTLKAIKSNAKGCIVEISASCDHALNKWKRHRIVPGFLISSLHHKHLKSNDALFVSPPFTSAKVFSESFYIVVDFSYFGCVGFKSLRRRKPICRLRKDLLVEIQTRLGRHINRPGILEL